MRSLLFVLFLITYPIIQNNNDEESTFICRFEQSYHNSRKNLKKLVRCKVRGLKSTDSLMIIPQLLYKKDALEFWNYKNPSYSDVEKFGWNSLNLGRMFVNCVVVFTDYGTVRYQSYSIREPLFSKIEGSDVLISIIKEREPHFVFTISYVGPQIWFFIIGDCIESYEISHDGSVIHNKNGSLRLQELIRNGEILWPIASPRAYAKKARAYSN